MDETRRSALLLTTTEGRLSPFPFQDSRGKVKNPVKSNYKSSILVADQNLDDLINETDSEDDDDEPRAKKSESKKFPDQLMEMEDGEVVDLSAAHETDSEDDDEIDSAPDEIDSAPDSEDDDEIDSAPDVLLTQLRDKLLKYVRLFDEETQRSEIIRKKLKFYYEKYNDERVKILL